MTSIGIRGRLFAGFFAILFIVIIAISIILVKTTTTESLAAQVINYDFPTHDAYFNLTEQIYITESALHNWLSTHEKRYQNEYIQAWNNIEKTQLTLDGLIKNVSNNTYVNTWQNVKVLLNQLKPLQDGMMNATPLTTITPKTTEVTTLTHRILDIINGPLSITGERKGGLFDNQYQQLEKRIQEVMNNIDFIRIIQYIMLGICLVFSICIALLTARSIIKPLHNAINIAKKIAAGDRHIKIDTTSTDETGDLLVALNIMQSAITNNEKELKQKEIQTRKLFDNIVQTANEFSVHSSKVSAGDLTQRLAIKTNDEMSKLGHDLNTMTESLATITQKITEACHNMVGSLEEVKHSVDVQSSGASEQASSINQITASLEEIEKSSNQTINKAKTLGEVAERTREKGQQGLEAVEQSVTGMKSVREKVQLIAQTILDLSNQTQQVDEITTVVNTLAQQSKMLALNASIEAAKAGEAGKGFAVVAVEVKNLAEQSEQSTTQVKKILEDIRQATEKAVMATEEGTKGVDHGTSLVEQTGEIVRNLSDVIHETTIASQHIESAIRQEGIGIEQITAGMNEINQVTSSFVESVKQTTEAIDDLVSITRNLKEYIDIYKI